MPFITEEIYHQLKEQQQDLCIKQFEIVKNIDRERLLQGELLKELVTTLRDARVKNNIKPKEAVILHIQTTDEKIYKHILPLLSKQVNAERIEFTNQNIPEAITIVIGKDKFFIETDQPLDKGAQKDQLIKDLEYLKGFLISVNKKLSNDRFVQNAKPEVINIERQKKKDAEEKIKTIEESLAGL
jgi:valyl-tRNA synthetase